MSENIIVLTQDSDLQQKLQRKLEEYDERLGSSHPSSDVDSFYKAKLLRTLLENGAVRINEIRGDLSRLTWFERDTFRNAVSVVALYNAGYAPACIGGTGLS